MRIIHTADWHIGQNFYSYDRDDEHAHFFDELAAIMGREKPDALVVCGDIFHTQAPSAPARRRLVEGILQLRAAAPDSVIVIIAGNHDSGSRLDADRRLWHLAQTHVIGGAARLSDGSVDPAQFIVEVPGRGLILAVPYFHTSNYPLISCGGHEADDNDIGQPNRHKDRPREFYEALIRSVADCRLPVVMMSHLAINGCDISGHEDSLTRYREDGDDSVCIGGMVAEDLELLGDGYDYLALGHIHKPQQLSDRAYYSGSPLPVNFTEDYNHYVNLIEIDSRGATPRVTRLPLGLRRQVLTIPPDGAPLDEALKALAALDDGFDGYVRVLVDQEQPLAADADERARKIVADKKCRFCRVHHKPRQLSTDDTDSVSIDDIADFLNLDPLEIAKQSYRRRRGYEMSPELIDKLKSAIKGVTQ